MEIVYKYGCALTMGSKAKPLALLDHLPEFVALRAQAQSDSPNLLGTISDLGNAHPELLQLINSNPADFVSMLAVQHSRVEAAAVQTNAAQQSPAQHVETQEPRQPQPGALERLCDLGFDRAAATAALAVCDSDEMQAANYLFESA